jgi:hypothetical protein
VKQCLETIIQAVFIKAIHAQVATNILTLKEYHEHVLHTWVNFALAE